MYPFLARWTVIYSKSILKISGISGLTYCEDSQNKSFSGVLRTIEILIFPQEFWKKKKIEDNYNQH